MLTVFASAQIFLDKVERLNRPPAKALANLPKGGPQPVFYFGAGARAPSCGLVTPGVSAQTITAIVEPEAGEDFPACLDITDASVFHVDGGTGFVFKYRQRDTREDTSNGYFFVRQSSTALQPLDELNQQTVPERKSIRMVATWARLALSTLPGEKLGYRMSAADSIVTETAFLAISRNAATGKCRTVVDLTNAHVGPNPLNIECKAVLASTSWEGGGATYFAILLEDKEGSAKGQVFVVRSDSVRRASDLEAAVASEIGSRKILKVKEALQKQVAAR